MAYGEKIEQLRQQLEAGLLLSDAEKNLFRDALNARDELQKKKGVTAILRVAGGWVRDKLLERLSTDVDMSIAEATGEEFARAMADVLVPEGEMKEVPEPQKDGSVNKKLTKGKMTITVIPKDTAHRHNVEIIKMILPDGRKLDVCGLHDEPYVPRGHSDPYGGHDGLRNDAEERDCRINAIYFRIERKQNAAGDVVIAGTVEDPIGGVEDLKRQLIRAPRDEALFTFEEDPVRILRCVRFAARLGFKCDVALFEGAQRLALRGDYKDVKRSRTVGEFLKACEDDHPADFVLSVIECGHFGYCFDPDGKFAYKLHEGTVSRRLKLLAARPKPGDNDTSAAIILATIFLDLGPPEIVKAAVMAMEFKEPLAEDVVRRVSAAKACAQNVKAGLPLKFAAVLAGV